jgi:HlyD family secretion protein
VIRTRGTALLALAAVLGGCGEEKSQGPKVATAPVTRRDIIVNAEASGTIEPINVIEVKSKASGQIVRMPVETGTQVKPGELLVAVDTRDVQNQYNQALADVRAAQSRLEISRAQRQRSEELFQQRIVTAQEREAAELDYANAEAQVVRVRASLDIAQQRLEEATVRAPVAGTVIEKLVSLGQVITSATGAFGGGTTLLKMADLDQVRVRAMVAESDIGQVQPGQPVTVTVDAYPDRPFRGFVEKIEPQAVIQQSVTMFPVLVSVSNRERLLMPGMNGEVAVLVSQRNDVLAIPNDASRSPREAAVVATALGLDPEKVTEQVREMTMGRGAAGAGNGAAPTNGAPVRAETARGDVGPQANRQERQRQRRVQGGDSAAPRGDRQEGQGPQGPIVRPGAPEVPGATGRARARSGLVFVAKNGTFEPRIVRLGVSNYDFTEVLSGVEEGEQVALLAAAALQQQRQQNIDRIRGMTGGGVPGMQRQQPGGAAQRPGGR